MEDELCLLSVVKRIGTQKTETSFQKGILCLKLFLIHLDMIYSFILFLHSYPVCATERVSTFKMRSDVIHG